ncbi:hypothetical protein O181_081495, partial [Austropuccinia psidii MF-1]|nr:hypothetical protein [Austropuccinia psidii MF-1]
MIIPVPSSLDLSTPPPRPRSDGHFTPFPERSDYPANEGWQWKEDIRAWADYSPVPSLPFEQTLRQPTPGPSGTRWSEELFR